MTRWLAAAALLSGWATVAAAQAPDCIDTIASWTIPYQQGTIQTVSYYVWQPPPPFPATRPPLLAVLFRDGDLHIHVNVPVAVARPFTTLASADQRYTATVQSRYQQTLIGAGLCPLLNEDGSYLMAEQP